MCSNFTEAWKILYNNHIKPNSLSIPDWQGFRTFKLWTLEVNDVLFVNLDNIKMVHQFYMSPTQKYMSQKDALNMCLKDTALGLTTKQARFCVGYCRMTLKAETAD